MLNLLPGENHVLNCMRKYSLQRCYNERGYGLKHGLLSLHLDGPSSICDFSVQDADKLDAIGAFGVLRCAAFSGARNISLFNPDDAPIEGMTKEQYEKQTENGGGSSINHFHGKYIIV